VSYFTFEQQIGVSWGEVAIDIRSLVSVEAAGTSVVLATTGPGGGMISLQYVDGVLEAFDQVLFSDDIRSSVTGYTALLEVGGQSYAVVGDTAQGVVVSYEMDGDGSLADQVSTSLPVYAGNSGPVIATSANGYIYTVTAAGRLQGFSNTNGTFNVVATHEDTLTSYTADPVALEVVTIAGTEYLIVLSAQDVGVTTFEIDAQSGALSQTDAVGVTTGLGLLNNPTDLETVTIADSTYAIVTSASDSAVGGALTVLKIDENGQMQVTDHILDSLNTRFGAAHTVEVAQVGEWTYVVAGGGDAGLSLFTLTPGGQLLHLDTIADSLSSGLETISALSLLSDGSDLQVFAASGASQGLSQLSIDQSEQGIVLEAASGRIDGTDQNDLLIGGIGDNDLRGGAGDDILLDGYGEDRLTGGDGADTFVFGSDGANDDIRDFEPGIDRIDFSAVPMLYNEGQLEVIEQSWGARIFLPSGEKIEVRSASGETLTEAQIFASIDWETDRPPMLLFNTQTGDDGDDVFEGSDGTDVFAGGEGNDTLTTSGGDDLLDGGNGHDYLSGGSGNDSLIGAGGFDTLIGGTGNDTLEGGWGADSIDAGDGNDYIFDVAQGGDANADTILGGNGDDTISSGDGADLIFSGNGSDYIEGLVGNDTVWAGDGDDTLVGGLDDDRLYGISGNDLLMGGNGRDLLEGGVGNDHLLGGNHRDTLNGGDGDDIIEGQYGVDVIDGGAGDDWIHGGSMGDDISGGDGADSINGGAGSDTVYMGDGDDVFSGFFQWGNLGKDTVWGGSGDDEIYAMAGHDAVHGESGDDIVSGGLGNDLVTGGTGNDTLIGGGGNDSLQGDNADDRLEGGAGADNMTGGSGSDTFVFEEGGGRDTVTDFQVNQDQLLFDTTSDNSLSDLNFVNAPRGLWIEWSGGSLLLEGLTEAQFDKGDVLFE